MKFTVEVEVSDDVIEEFCSITNNSVEETKQYIEKVTRNFCGALEDFFKRMIDIVASSPEDISEEELFNKVWTESFSFGLKVASEDAREL